MPRILQVKVLLGGVKAFPPFLWVTGLKVYMAVDRRPVAFFVFDDEVKPESKKVIKSLREAGYAVSMITGDRDENAKAVAAQIGIQEYYSALSLEEKIEFIRHFKSRLKNPIAMVGTA